MTGTTEDAAEVEALVRARAEAVLAKDAGVLLSSLHPEVVSYPLLPPTISHGRGPVEESIGAWFGGYADGPGYAVHDVRVETDGDLGYAAFFYHVSGTLDSGDVVDMWVRSTLVVRRGEDGWQVVHQHESVPFDAATGNALIGEAPPG